MVGNSNLAEEVADLESNLKNVESDLANACKGNALVQQKRDNIESSLIKKKKLLLLEQEEEERQKKLEQERIFKDFIDKPFVNLSKDKTYFTISILGEEFLFDNEKKEVGRLSVLSNVGGLNINDNGYLCAWDYPIHADLTSLERKELSEEFNCEIKDIHTHHINEDKQDNRKKNLEVLHKDNHAKRHGFDSWEAYQLWRVVNID